MNLDVGMVDEAPGRPPVGAITAKHPICILAMHYVDLMTQLSQCIRKAINKECVTSKVKRRIEGGHHAESHTLCHFASCAVRSSTLRVSFAACSHVNSLLLFKPAAAISFRQHSSLSSSRSLTARALGSCGSK